jgi:hypothetical protein
MTGVSPTEICVASSKPPTITTVVNPLESIINTVAGLKSFDFESAAPDLDAAVHSMSPEYLFRNRTANPPPPPPPSPADQVLALFRSLAATLNDTAKPVFGKQTHWQHIYLADIDAIARYMAADYRGTGFPKFHPDDDPLLAAVREHSSLPPLGTRAATLQHSELDTPPTEVDYAALQALADQMKTLQTGLVSACSNNPTASGAPTCDASVLRLTAEVVDRANAMLNAAGDNLKTLQTVQTAVATNFAALHKMYIDYQGRKAANVITEVKGVLVQHLVLGPDYGATDAGTLTCSTDATPSVATTDAINYSVLYQNIPAFTVSAGLLTTFLKKQEIGTTTKLNSDGSYTTLFAVTDSARASVFPMAFVNYRLWAPALRTWPGQPENELVLGNSLSAGIGINPNTGTNQVEFFLGDTISFNRVNLHFGAHFGRTEGLGGGFQLNAPVPTMPSNYSGQPPIDWAYHVAFSIGLSVRIAPF